MMEGVVLLRKNQSSLSQGAPGFRVQSGGSVECLCTVQ